MPDMIDPECRQGEAMFASRDGCRENKVRYFRCGADCRFETEPTACGGGCDGVRRTFPRDAEEICLPGGVFTRGCDDPRQDCFPRHDVYLSPFYIDRFTVTVRRYQECVDAGACAELTSWEYRGERISDFDPEHFVFGLIGVDEDEFDFGTVLVWGATRNQAVAYCEWDGARLATGAEWERAATGVYDRAVWPWTDSLDPDPSAPSMFFPISVTLLPRRSAYPFNYLTDPLPFSGHATTNSVGIDAYFDYFEWTADTLGVYEPMTPPERDPVVTNGERTIVQEFYGYDWEMRGLQAQGSPFTYRNDIAARFNAGDERGVSNFGWERASIRCVRPTLGER